MALRPLRGGLFRYILNRSLSQAAEMTGNRRLEDSTNEFQQIGDHWEALVESFRLVPDSPHPAALAVKAQTLLDFIAARE